MATIIDTSDDEIEIIAEVAGSRPILVDLTGSVQNKSESEDNGPSVLQQDSMEQPKHAHQFESKAHIQPTSSNLSVSPQERLDQQVSTANTRASRESIRKLKEEGNDCYRQNLFDEAIKLYRDAIELALELKDTDILAILHFNLGLAYCRVGSLNQAIDECAKATKLNETYTKAHLKRAEIYLRQKKYEEAIICYEHLKELDSLDEDYMEGLNFAKNMSKSVRKQSYRLTLGLVNPNPTLKDLKVAYRQKALLHHPDKHSHSDIVTRKINEKYFKDIAKAYSVLKPKLSRRYNYM